MLGVNFVEAREPSLGDNEGDVRALFQMQQQQSVAHTQRKMKIDTFRPMQQIKRQQAPTIGLIEWLNLRGFTRLNPLVWLQPNLLLNPLNSIFQWLNPRVYPAKYDEQQSN